MNLESVCDFKRKDILVVGVRSFWGNAGCWVVKGVRYNQSLNLTAEAWARTRCPQENGNS